MPDGATVAGALAQFERCDGCGTELAPSLLRCPGCRRLVHHQRITQFCADASEAEAGGEAERARELWEAALVMLPPDAEQHRAITQRLSELAKRADATPATPRPSLAGKGAVLAAALLLLWKLKPVLLFALGKGKLLLLGLSKFGTVFSMLLSAGVYAAAYGWRLGVGLVLSIYVHEMGHVAELRRHGIRASAPMFIPGIGAFVRLQQELPSEQVDAEVGLAGPLWGLGAALAAYGMMLATGAPVWGAIAGWGAIINLFNLTPVWQLDGARAFRAMDRAHRAIALAGLALALALTREGLLVLPLAFAAFSLFTTPARTPHPRATALYVFLTLAFAGIAEVAMPPLPGR